MFLRRDAASVWRSGRKRRCRVRWCQPLDQASGLPCSNFKSSSENRQTLAAHSQNPNELENPLFGTAGRTWIVWRNKRSEESETS